MAKKTQKPKKTKRTVAEHKLDKEHKGHDLHLCGMVAQRKMDKVASLVEGAQYVCNICGRGAAKARNLCEPVAI